MLLIINMVMHGFNPNNTSNSNYSNYSAIQIMYVGTRIICMELALLWTNNASSNLQILTARDVLFKIIFIALFHVLGHADHKNDFFFQICHRCHGGAR